MTVAHLDASDLRALMSSFRDALVAHRPALNLLNVYPVPDGDTGSNMTMTVESVVAELDGLNEDLDMEAATGAIAHGSLMGARGNSGVILSQVLRGLASAFAAAGSVDGRLMADGLAAAATAAYEAVMTPVEGTILTVVRESAEAAVVTADAGGDLLAVGEAARTAGGESLARTPELLPVLEAGGIVIHYRGDLVSEAQLHTLRHTVRRGVCRTARRLGGAPAARAPGGLPGRVNLVSLEL